jgi:hypothetical protein
VRKELSFVSDTEVLVLLERITKKFSHNSWQSIHLDMPCLVSRRSPSCTFLLIAAIDKENQSDISDFVLGMVAHIYYPTYLGGRNWRYQGSRPDWAKSYWDPKSTNKPGIMVHTCYMVVNPNHTGGVGRRIAVLNQPQAKTARPYTKNS